MEEISYKKYIAPMMRVIAPICAEETLETVPNGSGEPKEADAKHYNGSFSKWDDEEEE